MTSEQRVVRPYAGLESVQRRLTRLRLEFAGQSLSASGRLSVAVTVFLAERITIVTGSDEQQRRTNVAELLEAVEQAGFAAHQVDLALVLGAPRLRVQQVAWRTPIDELDRHGQRIDVGGAGARPVALAAPFGGCDATLAVVLADDLDPRPLRPFRRGTWLARTHHRIATDLGQIGFTPIPLTEEVRAEHELPARTLRLITAERVTDPEMDPDASLTVYVDQEVLAQLAAEPRSRGSRSLQMQLFLDAMTAVVHAGSREIAAGEGSDTFLDAQESLLGSLVRQMAAREDEVDMELAQHYWTTVKNQPERAVALIEGWLPDFKNALVNSISEGAS